MFISEFKHDKNLLMDHKGKDCQLLTWLLFVLSRFALSSVTFGGLVCFCFAQCKLNTVHPVYESKWWHLSSVCESTVENSRLQSFTPVGWSDALPILSLHLVLDRKLSNTPPPPPAPHTKITEKLLLCFLPPLLLYFSLPLSPTRCHYGALESWRLPVTRWTVTDWILQFFEYCTDLNSFNRLNESDSSTRPAYFNHCAPISFLFCISVCSCLKFPWDCESLF